MSATLIRLGDRTWRFGEHVTVRGLVQPWIGHNATSTPRYYEGRRPASFADLAVQGIPSADDGAPDTWPGSPCTGSDTPWPAQHEVLLRWRRFTVDPRPVRGVLLRTVTRPEGIFHYRALKTHRRVRLAEVVIDTKPPRRIQVDPADLMPGWRAAA